MKYHRIFLLLVCCFLTVPGRAAQLHIAVASNFFVTMQQLASSFEKASPHRVILSSGSSGKLYAQICNGAPYHAFFSADQTKPSALEANGFTLPGTRITYALGQLALISSDPNTSQPSRELLEAGKFNKLALANPRLAPYGTAAVQVLESLGLNHELQHKWVLGENIAQAFQFIRSGNAELGFVALSQLDQSAQVPSSTWLIPTTLHQPIRQDAVLLKSANDHPAATTFWVFLNSDTAKQIITGAGYRLSSPP